MTTAEHIAIINEELGVVKNDIGWIKKFIFILIPLLGGMVVSLIFMIIK